MPSTPSWPNGGAPTAAEPLCEVGPVRDLSCLLSLMDSAWQQSARPAHDPACLLSATAASRWVRRNRSGDTAGACHGGARRHQEPLRTPFTRRCDGQAPAALSLGSPLPLTEEQLHRAESLFRVDTTELPSAGTYLALGCADGSVRLVNSHSGRTAFQHDPGCGSVAPGQCHSRPGPCASAAAAPGTRGGPAGAHHSASMRRFL